MLPSSPIIIEPMEPKFHKTLQQLHHTRKERNKAQFMKPGSSIVQAIQKYRVAQENYSKALKDCRQAKRTDDDLRKLHRQELARNTAEANGTNCSNEYDKILHIES